MSHRIIIYAIQYKRAGLGIGLNQALALQETARTPGNGVGESGEFVTGRRLHPLKPLKRPVPAFDVHTVQKKHVKINVEIQRTPKTLDQRHRTRVGGLSRKPRLFDQVRGNGAVDDPKYFAHVLPTAGEQEPLQIWKTQHPTGEPAERETPRPQAMPRSRPCAAHRSWVLSTGDFNVSVGDYLAA